MRGIPCYDWHTIVCGGLHTYVEHRLSQPDGTHILGPVNPMNPVVFD